MTLERMKMEKLELPDVPSQLLNLAMDDFEKCLALPEKYMIDMHGWAYRRLDGVCEVCLAGAVMCQTLDASVPPRNFKIPEDYASDGLDAKLKALDHIRCGDIDYAFEEMGMDTDLEFDRDITDPKDSMEGFITDMRNLAEDLEAAGL